MKHGKRMKTTGRTNRGETRFVFGKEIKENCIRYGITILHMSGIVIETTLETKKDTLHYANRTCKIAWENMNQIKNVIIWEQEENGEIHECFVLYKVKDRL